LYLNDIVNDANLDNEITSDEVLGTTQRIHPESETPHNFWHMPLIIFLPNGT
jgi:hypothetical protein